MEETEQNSEISIMNTSEIDTPIYNFVGKLPLREVVGTPALGQFKTQL